MPFPPPYFSFFIVIAHLISVIEHYRSISRIGVSFGILNLVNLAYLKSDPDQIHDSEADTDSQDGTIMLFYKNQVCDDFKEIERTMRKIIYRNLLPTHPDKKCKLRIYYAELCEARSASQNFLL